MEGMCKRDTEIMMIICLLMLIEWRVDRAMVPMVPSFDSSHGKTMRFTLTLLVYTYMYPT